MEVSRVQRYRAAVFVACLLLLVPLLLFPQRPIILAARFAAWAGWVEVFLLALYGAWLAGKAADAKAWPAWRRRSWLLLSAVFFAQLALGLAGLERFLMSGALHLPVPALIVAGPFWRGQLGFMPFLFVGTALVVGPAWCSHLCYLGSWDEAFASGKASAGPLPARSLWIRLAVLLLAVGGAILLRLLHAPLWLAVGAGLLLGAAGVAVMALVSRRTGSMAHCSAWCPTGLAANLIGRLSPFRMRVSNECNACAACTRRCRLGALSPQDLARGRPGLTCTLCGDCLPACSGSFIRYRFPGLGAARSRSLFVAVIVALHVTTLATARI